MHTGEPREPSVGPGGEGTNETTADARNRGKLEKRRKRERVKRKIKKVLPGRGMG